MKFKVVIAENGDMAFFAEDGTFAQGKIAIATMVAAIQAGGVAVPQVSDVEQHRHDNEQLARAHDMAHQAK